MVVSLIYRVFCEQGFVCWAIFNEFCSLLHIWLRSAPLPHSCAVCRFVSHLICRLVFMKYWSQAHNPYSTCESILDRVRLGLIVLLSSIQAFYAYISPLDVIWEIFFFIFEIGILYLLFIAWVISLCVSVPTLGLVSGHYQDQWLIAHCDLRG